jgi:predicted metalloprotease
MKEKPERQAPDGDMAFFNKMISSRAGGDWAYANASVKAYILQRLSAEDSETWLGNGAAQRRSKAVLKF